jgi:hypothetical protein
MKTAIGIVLALFAFMAPSTGLCELEGRAFLDASLPGIRLYQQPKVHIPAGWRVDEEVGQQLQCLVLVRVEEDPDNPLTLIYAMAVPREGQGATLPEFIRDDIAAFTAGSTDVVVGGAGTVPSARGPLAAYTFRYTYEGKRFLQTVAYGEEGDHFVTFTLTGKTAEAHDRGMADFRAVVGSYR